LRSIHITYKPEDGERQEWDFEPGRIRNSVASMIVNQFGGSYDEWKLGVQKNDPKARRVLLWHLMTQDHAKMRLADVPDFYDDELVVEYSSAEIDELRTKVEKSNMANKDMVLAALEVDYDEAVAREKENPLPGKPNSTELPIVGG